MCMRISVKILLGWGVIIIDVTHMIIRQRLDKEENCKGRHMKESTDILTDEEACLA